ncbi:MAG: methyltransferase domain-containing protein [Desulfuromonadales bacterium]|nr:methyltransferase domain-containing protein [Desulfuromonadales bacterium]
MGPVSAIDGRLLRTHFSSHAGDYDRYAAVQKRVVAHLAARLAASGPLTGLVLDVGTGTGALALELGGVAVDRRFVLSDLAHGMTKTAAQRLPGALSCDGDARRFPFADGSFTAVVSSSVYQWVGDLPAAFREVSRVLRPGGRFAVALFGERTLYELRNAHRQAVVECNSDHPSHAQNFPSAAEVTSALDAAGMIRRDFACFPEIDWHPDVPALLRQLKQIGASNAAADRPHGLAPRRVMQRMLEIYEACYRFPEGIPATYEVVCAVAEKP